MKKFILFIVVIAIIYSCDDIIAKDISQDVPVLILPQEGDSIASNPIHFKWEQIDGATKYHLMVVRPNFSQIQEYVLDTLVSTTDFYYSLDSSYYQLMLCAVNAGYVSDTIGPVNFSVGVNSGGTSNQVSLNLPNSGDYLNANFNKLFTWQALSNAIYEISIRKGSSFSTGLYVDGINNLSSTQFTSVANFSEGEYYWGVRADFTNGGQTIYSTRHFFIDETDPNQAVLVSPVNLSSVFSGTITFTWNNGSDPGSIHAPVISMIEIATDAGFGNLVSSQILIGNAVDINLNSGTYYWRVTNYDDAGNYAATSTVFQLNIS